MKAILEFNLPEDNNEHKIAFYANRYYCALFDISDWIRDKVKYSNLTQIPLEELRKKFYEILEDNSVNLDEIE